MTRYRIKLKWRGFDVAVYVSAPPFDNPTPTEILRHAVDAGAMTWAEAEYVESIHKVESDGSISNYIIQRGNHDN